MKKIIFPIFAVAALVMVSCSDDFGSGNKVAKVGDEIKLSASVKTQSVTRTVYGPQNTTTKVWPIYWAKNDEVDVFCPDASTNDGNKQLAKYKVTTPDTDDKTQYTLQGENSLHWGPDDLHHFYTFYPAGNVDVDSWTGGTEGSLTVSANVPSTQTVTYDETTGVWADMNSALMAGITTANRSNSDQNIVLPFKPITTALDITINPTDDDLEEYTITGLIVSNVATVAASAGMEDLTGDFTYTIGGANNGKSVYGENVSRTLQVRFRGGIEGFKKTSSPIKVTVFLLPNVSTNLRIQVLATSKSGANVALSKSCAKTQVVTSGCKNQIILPALPAVQESNKINGANWVTNVFGPLYVKDLSIPGSYDSMNYSKDVNGCDKTQTKGIVGCNDNTPDQEIINHQLNNGVRAFDLRLQYTTQRGYFYVNRNNFSSSKLGPDESRDVKFEPFIEHAVSWLQEHPTEFLIMFVRPFTAERHYWLATGNIRGGGKENFNAYLPTVMANLKQQYGPYILDSFDPNIKVEEARGKILFIFDGDYTGTVYGNKLTEALPLSTVNGSTYTKTMTFTNGTGNLIFHNYDMQTKTDTAWPYHNKAIEAAANNHDDWNVTCLADYAVGGTSEAALAQGYDDHAAVYNPKVITYINNTLVQGQKTGIVLGCYMATTGDAKGLDLINAIWDFNFKFGGQGNVIQH